MKKKVIMIAGIFLVVAAAFMIYFIFSDSSIQPIDTVERDALGSLIGVYDEQILHMEFDTEGYVVFSLFVWIEETGGWYSLHIATIENPKIVLNEMVLIGNCLYVNIIMNEQGEPMYTYKINLMSRAVEPIRKVESYDTFVPIAAYGEEIAILECKTLDGVHGESIISTLEDNRELLVRESNREDFSGEYIWDFTAVDDSLFTIINNWTENKTFLEQYNSDLEKIQKIDITETIDYLEKQNIKDFCVFDRFAFISNFSRSSALLSISGDSAFRVVESTYDTPFVRAKSNQSEPIFFIADSPFVFYLDEENDKIVQSKIKFEEECRIKDMVVGENMTVFVLEDANELYMVDNKDLFSNRKREFSVKNKTYVATTEGLKRQK